MALSSSLQTAVFSKQFSKSLLIGFITLVCVLLTTQLAEATTLGYDIEDDSQYTVRLDGGADSSGSGDRALTTSVAGDINGDGVEDFAVAAHGLDTSRADVGRVYVIFGSSSFSSSNINLSDIGSAKLPGFDITASRSDEIGNIAPIGDVNSDGLDDLLIGSPYAEPTSFGSSYDSGISYVVYGQSVSGTGGTADRIKLGDFATDTTHAHGFEITGLSREAELGTSVTSAGDLDADGTNDLLISANNAAFNGDTSPSVYALLSTELSGSNIDLSTELPGYRIDLPQASTDTSSDTAITEVRAKNAGDINGDGTPDQLIGFAEADIDGAADFGSAWIVYGKSSASSTATVLNLEDEGNSTAARFDGGADTVHSLSAANVGISVDSAGDVNNDDYPDIIIGAANSSTSSERLISGSAYVIFGGPDLASVTKLLSITASNGYLIEGSGFSELTGAQVLGIGDVNGDHYDDQLIGSPGKRISSRGGTVFTPAGGICLILGQGNTGTSKLRIDDLGASNDGLNSDPESDGWCYNGSESQEKFGSDSAYQQLSVLDDTNGDGFQDLLIGSNNDFNGGTAGSDGSGSIYLTNVNPLATAKTADVTDITYDSALLSGTVNPNSHTTSYYFEYSKSKDFTDSLRSTPDTPNIGSGTETLSLSDIVTELEPSTTYYYRMVAVTVSADGQVFKSYGNSGNSESFTTPVNPDDVDGDGDADGDDDFDSDGDIDADDFSDYNGGDINHDGSVNDGDDYNGDGTINKEDYIIYRDTLNVSTVTKTVKPSSAKTTTTSPTTTSPTEVTTAANNSCLNLVAGNAASSLSSIRKIKSAKAQLKIGSGYLTNSGSSKLSLAAPKGGKLPKLKSVTFYVDKTKLAVDKRKAYQTTLSATSLANGKHTVKALLKPKKGKSVSVKTTLIVGECEAGVFTGSIAATKPNKKTSVAVSYKGSKGVTATTVTLPTKAFIKFGDLRKLKKKKVGSLQLIGGKKMTLKVSKNRLKKKSATLLSSSGTAVKIKLGSRPKITITGMPSSTTGFNLKLGGKSSKLMLAGKASCKLAQFAASLTAALGEKVALKTQTTASCRKS